ncbi:hypothetical protein EYF80_048214 [Liparis tanakae]|uniref:Uncharacterized protein n=1 Tax=Liparis tanakae TaxID=230148 RepID=A0A4Z2FKT3_9TELE|nr:hypothetical protein EYF80_048214 [Liparis tanakae]
MEVRAGSPTAPPPPLVSPQQREGHFRFVVKAESCGTSQQNSRGALDFSTVFNVYFSVVSFWLSNHIWLFRLVSSQLISQLIDARCRQRVWQPQRAVQPRHVILSVRVA